MDFATFQEQDQRLIILRALADELDGHLNETLLQKHLERFGHRVARLKVRTLMRELELKGAVRLHEPATDMLVAEITARGQDHVERREAIEGVAVPSRRPV